MQRLTHRVLRVPKRRVSGRRRISIPSKVVITDVSPRDGLQNEKLLLPLATKLELIHRLQDAGVSSMEVTAFVSPKAVPQMADAPHVMQSIVSNTNDKFFVLVPNVKGLNAAVAAGAKHVTVLTAASETMCQKNTRCSLETAMNRASEVLAIAKAKNVNARVAIAVSFVCPWEGNIDLSRLASIAHRLYSEGASEVCLCDTIGKANPKHIQQAIDVCVAAGVPVEALNLHVHDTYGQANSNMMAGLYQGIQSFDVSVGGIGGCPFAPGASGNAASEDFIYSLQNMGVETGIDLDKLAHTGAWINAELGRPHGSRAGGAIVGRAARSRQTIAQRKKSSSDLHIDAGRTGPLTGYRVVEMGNFLAGPFCCTTLAYFGADVIKVETPGAGDPIRTWRGLAADGTAPWARSLLRNKRSVTINLKNPEGLKVVRELIESADAVVENFKPGLMEKFGIGPDDFKESNPGLVYTRVSGYGQSGPYKTRAGFASATEAEGGFRFVNGFPGQPPVRPNMSLGDSLAGVQAAMGTVMALLSRSRQGKMYQKGQVVDMALYEAVFNMMEGVIPDYTALGVVREASGTTLTGIVPTITASCSDGKFVVIGANHDKIYPRVMKLCGREDLGTDSRLALNAGRVKHKDEIEPVIEAWVASLPQAEVLEALNGIGCPCGPVYDASDMLSDPHFIARGMFEDIETPTGLKFKIPAMVPKLSETPGNTEWCGPDVGTHNVQVLKDYLGYDDATISGLRESKAIGSEDL